jgi:hypothetical protein
LLLTDNAVAPVNFTYWTLFAAAPALADLDGDLNQEIVFSADDTLSIFDLGSRTSLVRTRSIGFGTVQTVRLHPYSQTPQPIVADIDNNGLAEIVTTHNGDGFIHAFHANGAVVSGFPLKVKGKLEHPCIVTDLEANGKLDLVALDNAGYIYAWELAQGSIQSQPWPEDFNNTWNNSNPLYRSIGSNGYLYETWTDARAVPFSWFETGINNDTVIVTPAAFFRDPGMRSLKSSGAGDRNYHFRGPHTKDLKNYTVSGTLKFDSSASEFGMNFYSQWPASPKKYSIIRKTDRLAYLYYYNRTSATLLGVLNAATTGNDSLKKIDCW